MRGLVTTILTASWEEHGVRFTRARLTVCETTCIISFEDVINLLPTNCLKYSSLLFITPEHTIKLERVPSDTTPLLMVAVFASRAFPLLH